MEPAEDATRWFAFAATLWLWDARQSESWTFVTVPPAIGDELDAFARATGPRRGFGSIKVEVRIGGTNWRTSVFPDSASGCFVLPVKRAVRAANGVEAGDEVAVEIRPAG